MTRLDDALLEAYQKSVWWAIEEDQSSLNLQKAPAVWDSMGELGEFIREKIREIVQRPGVVYDRFERADDPQAAQKVRDALEAELTDPQGWTLGEVAQRIEEALDVPQATALDYARNEVAPVLNTAREEGYEEYAEELGHDPDEYVFDWVGPDDHRTTDICREIKEEIESRGGAVPMDELKEILRKKARKYIDDGGTPNRVEEFLPHFECRHTFTRRVQSI